MEKEQLTVDRGVPELDSKWSCASPIPKFPMFWGGEGGSGINVPTFDTESKSAKMQNSLYPLGGEGCPGSMFQLLMLSPNLLKRKIPYVLSFAETFKGFCHKIGPFQFVLVFYKRSPCTKMRKRKSTINFLSPRHAWDFNKKTQMIHFMGISHSWFCPHEIKYHLNIERLLWKEPEEI